MSAGRVLAKRQIIIGDSGHGNLWILEDTAGTALKGNAEAMGVEWDWAFVLQPSGDYEVKVDVVSQVSLKDLIAQKEEEE